MFAEVRRRCIVKKSASGTSQDMVCSWPIPREQPEGG